MSRPLVLGVLIVLLGLVAVMANIANKPYRKEDPKPDASTAAAQQQARDKLAEAGKMRPKPPMPTSAGAPGLGSAGARPGAPVRKYGQMDLSEDWYKRRADGEAGVAELKVKDAQEKKWQAEDTKKMLKAMPTQAAPEPKAK